ncbi:MAG: peptidase M29 [SAR324 cluster bacterium]|nr:peptidase M29 [SAR324 cluster bacterium]
MLQERIEGKWIETFTRVFEHCKVETGTVVAILSETQSRPVNVQLAELALHRLGAQAFHLIVPSPVQSTNVPIRSTGASIALQGIRPILSALAQSEFVVDLTVEGLLHAPEVPEILKNGARALMISNEHPDTLERLLPDPELTKRVKIGLKKLRAARKMRVTSPAGTLLEVDVSNAPLGAAWGYADRPGLISHWPGGLCLCFPQAKTVNGSLVLAPGDINLTFKRYIENPIMLTIEDDFITKIEGEGVDADLFRDYTAAWSEEEAYAVSHVGWGMNPAARWDAMAMYDKRDFNGTELRAFAGNFLYSTGANETAGRHTQGHFDLPMRNCTIFLDGEEIVKQGVLQGELAP